MEKTVIFSLDGTSCDPACGDGAPKQPIIELAHMCDDAGHQIIIVSGRAENVRQETVEWLERHGVVYTTLHMRPNDCITPDVLLDKAQLDDGLFGKKENILFVVENNNRKAQMWRTAGLVCFLVEQNNN